MSNISVSPPQPTTNTGQVLFSLRGANMQSASDQVFTKLFSGTNYMITHIVAVRATGAGSVACAGGIYDAASKGGNAIVGVAQSWVTLAANVSVVPTIAAVVSTALLTATPILSLTTGSTAACTATIFIFGYCVD